MKGRPRVKVREKVVKDLLVFELTAKEIASKYDISSSTVHAIAVENNIDMRLRTKALRLLKKIKALEKEFDPASKAFFETHDNR
jgi:FixJ family two-component response regulator